ncbi:hypothetical protein NL334_27255, partial [Klebsiella pneumoniae]|nr:hypothetical protein [Klebsiella pneumoniae]
DVLASTKVLRAEHRDQLEKIAKAIAEASLSLASSPTGIQYGVDKKLGTDRHVFSILGYNTGHYGDAMVHLKPEIMLHPDFNVTS